jgi:choline/glycine/proline betaine transport protein
MSKVTRSDTKKSLGLEVNGPVFWTSIIILIISITLVLVFREGAVAFFSDIQSAVTSSMGWLFILSVNIFVGFCLYMAFGKFGDIRLGGKEAKPEFSTSSWFAMLFSAGMGIGLVASCNSLSGTRPTPPGTGKVAGPFSTGPGGFPGLRLWAYL